MRCEGQIWNKGEYVRFIKREVRNRKTEYVKTVFWAKREKPREEKSQRRESGRTLRSSYVILKKGLTL